MSSKSLILNQNVTMSSLEIAELTGKEHKNVLRDIREMLQELEGGRLKSEPTSQDLESGALPESEQTYLDSQGKAQPYYQLGEELTLTLLTGYSTKLRNAVVKRWKELERRLAEQTVAPLLQALPDNHLGNETLRTLHGIYQSARAQGELDALEVLRPHLSTLYAELDNDVVDTLREAVYARIRERESFLESRKEHPLAKAYRGLGYTKRELTANTYRKRLPWTPEGLEFELKTGVEPDRDGIVQPRYQVLTRD